MADKNTIHAALAKLGIDLPRDPIPDATGRTDAAEVIRTIMDAAFFGHPEASWNSEDMFDAFTCLDLMAARMSHALGRRSIRAVTTYDRPGDHTMGQILHRTCEHRLVQVSEDLDRLKCRDCGAGVNPIWWLTRYAANNMASEQWVQHLKYERKQLEGEVAALKAERSRHKSAIRRKSKP